MEREINNKIFTKLYLKIKVRGKEISDIIFCKKETTWKKRSIDYSKCEYLLHKNSNSNENMLFLSKTDKTIWKPPLSKSIPPLPPPPLSTKPPISEQFFMTSLFVQISKTRYPSLILGGRELWSYTWLLVLYIPRESLFISTQFLS